MITAKILSTESFIARLVLQNPMDSTLSPNAFDHDHHPLIFTVFCSLSCLCCVVFRSLILCFFFLSVAADRVAVSGSSPRPVSPQGQARGTFRTWAVSFHRRPPPPTLSPPHLHFGGILTRGCFPPRRPRYKPRYACGGGTLLAFILRGTRRRGFRLFCATL